MAKFVEKLYLDKISAEDRGYKNNQRLMDTLKKVNDLEDKLLQKLHEEEKSVLIDFMEAFTELSSITVADTYAIGFRQGSQFTYETLSIEDPFDDEEIIIAEN